jgi:hypothetical protein
MEHTNHLLVIRVLVIVLSLALVALTFVHHHQRGQITVFLICEIGLALLLALASLTMGLWW